jgi:hypothetical protein
VAVRLPGVWEDTVPPPVLCPAPAGGGAAGPLRPGRPGGAGRRAALLLRLCWAAAAGHAPGTGGQQTFTHLGGGVNTTLIKKQIKFSSYIRNSEWSSCKVITNGLLIYRGNICAFPHLLGSPSSYMTLQLLHSEFPYI